RPIEAVRCYSWRGSGVKDRSGKARRLRGVRRRQPFVEGRSSIATITSPASSLGQAKHLCGSVAPTRTIPLRQQRAPQYSEDVQEWSCGEAPFLPEAGFRQPADRLGCIDGCEQRKRRPCLEESPEPESARP